MIQVQLVIEFGEKTSIQCNLLEREDCTDPEREIAHAIEEMHLSAFNAMACEKSIAMIGEQHARREDESSALNKRISQLERAIWYAENYLEALVEETGDGGGTLEMLRAVLPDKESQEGQTDEESDE